MAGIRSQAERGSINPSSGAITSQRLPALISFQLVPGDGTLGAFLGQLLCSWNCFCGSRCWTVRDLGMTKQMLPEPWNGPLQGEDRRRTIQNHSVRPPAMRMSLAQHSSLRPFQDQPDGQLSRNICEICMAKRPLGGPCTI